MVKYRNLPVDANPKHNAIQSVDIIYYQVERWLPTLWSVGGGYQQTSYDPVWDDSD